MLGIKMRGFFVKAVLVLFSFVVVGCASVKPSQSESLQVKDDPSLDIVAVDLISVLGQLPGFDSWSMTTQVSPTRTSYGKAIVNALTEAGYGVQRVSADQGQNHVEYKESSIIESTGTSNAFEIKVRGVRIARQYKRSNNRWIPSSPVLVYGATPTRVAVFNELHSDDAKSTRFSSGVVFHKTNGDVIESRESVVGVANAGNSNKGTDNANLSKRALSLSQASTFARQRATASDGKGTYKRIAEVMLNFPSPDPSRLGQGNKQAVASLLESSSPGEDRFVIQGCVQEKTLRWDGTESIALERQQRVNKELIISGVKPEAIRELGCFKDDTRSGLSRQAVSVILERKVAPL